MLLYVTTATFSPLFLKGIPERKMELDFSSVWQLNSWRKLFCSFWAQQRSCLGREQVPTTLQIFSSQLAIINFKTFSPRNFPTRESREQCILWEDKARLWGWTGTQSLRCKQKMDEKWKMGRRASRHRSITIGLRRATRECRWLATDFKEGGK